MKFQGRGKRAGSNEDLRAARGGVCLFSGRRPSRPVPDEVGIADTSEQRRSVPVCTTPGLTPLSLKTIIKTLRDKTISPSGFRVLACGDLPRTNRNGRVPQVGGVYRQSLWGFGGVIFFDWAVTGKEARYVKK